MNDLHLVLGLFKRILFELNFHLQFDYVSLGCGAVINPQGDHPHAVVNVTLFFVSATAIVTVCLHPKDHKHDRQAENEV